jgi:DNA-binding response OmpR family regulator
MVIAAPDLLAGHDVLLVEDETMISFLVEEFLAELGAPTVRHAARVRDALKVIDATTPSLAVLDVNLAGEQVFPVAERLRALNVPFIFVTGYGRAGVDARWDDCAVLQKPMDAQRLEQALRKLLGREPRFAVR